MHVVPVNAVLPPCFMPLATYLEGWVLRCLTKFDVVEDVSTTFIPHVLHTADRFFADVSNSSHRDRVVRVDRMHAAKISLVSVVLNAVYTYVHVCLVCIGTSHARERTCLEGIALA